jgi:4-amino-4-deoxy-L-arabinose transferase-like glycosyltransferase
MHLPHTCAAGNGNRRQPQSGATRMAGAGVISAWHALRSDRELGFIVILLAMRVVFLLLGHGILEGDGLGYVRTAQHIINTGKLPPAQWQAVGYSLFLVPIMLLLGRKAIDFTYEQQTYFRTPIADAVYWVHILADVVVVVILIHEARKLFRSSAPAGFGRYAYAFLCLQPFTIVLASTVYPDHMCMFFVFMGCYLLYRHFVDTAQIAYLATGSLALGLAGLMRVDMIPVAGTILVIVLLLKWRSSPSRSNLAPMAVCGALFLAPPLGMCAFQYYSTGEIGYVRINMPYNPNVTRGGYFAWARTWIMFVQGENVLFGFADYGVPKTWAGFNVEAFPSRAFRSLDEKKKIGGLLKSWQENGYTSDIDASFQQIAASRKSKNWILTFVVVPAVRMMHYWINLEGAREIQVVLNLEPPWSRVATALVFPFRLLFVLLGLIGFYVIWVKQWAGIFRWSDGLDLARLCSLVVLLRTGELGLFGLFIASGLMETRYAVVTMPALLILATLGFRGVIVIVGQRRQVT